MATTEPWEICTNISQGSEEPATSMEPSTQCSMAGSPNRDALESTCGPGLCVLVVLDGGGKAQGPIHSRREQRAMVSIVLDPSGGAAVPIPDRTSAETGAHPSSLLPPATLIAYTHLDRRTRQLPSSCGRSYAQLSRETGMKSDGLAWSGACRVAARRSCMVCMVLSPWPWPEGT